MDQPLNPITKSVFNDLLETQTHLRDEAERRWLTARRFILEIAGFVASEWLYEKQTSGADLERIPLETLTSIIREQVTKLVLQSSTTPVTVPEPDLRQKYQRLVESFRQAETQNRQLETEKANLVNTLTRLSSETQRENTDPKPTNGVPQYQNWESLPNFFVEWTQEKFFERQSALLRLMGDTGLARHPELEKQIAEISGIALGSESLSNIFKALRDRNFVRSYTMEASVRGQPPGVDELTELGEAAYFFLTGKKAMSSEMADGLSEHKTQPHLLLVLKSKDWLKKAGYEILERESRFQLADGGQFVPDIIAEKAGETVYIEVERDSKKGNQDRDRKWNNFFDFTDGRLYVICQNEKLQRSLIREINSALGSYKLERAVISLCDLEKVNDEFIRENGHIWTAVRHKQVNTVTV